LTSEKSPSHREIWVPLLDSPTEAQLPLVTVESMLSVLESKPLLSVTEVRVNFLEKRLDFLESAA
jgi:hypothetical protein